MGGLGWVLASLVGLAVGLEFVAACESCDRFFGLLWLSVATGSKRRGVGGGGFRVVCRGTADATSSTGLNRREDRVAGFVGGDWSFSSREAFGPISVGVSCVTIGGALTAVKV